MRNTLAPTLLAGTLALAGCASGHGKYTSGERAGAQERFDGIKSGTEYQMAFSSFMSQDFPKALRHVDTSIALNPTVVRSHVLRGRIMLEAGDLQRAADSFERAQAIDPKAVDPWYYSGLLHERTAEREQALDCYQKACELAPSDAQYALAAAEVLIDMARLDDARAFLEERRPQFQHNSGIRQTLGHIAMIQQDPATAVKEFTDARLLAPDDQSIAEDLVRAQVKLDRYAHAETILAKLLADPSNQARRDLLMLRATCLTKMDRLAEARTILTQLTRDAAGADDTEAFVALGNVSYVMKDMVRVRQVATRIVNIAPHRPEGYMLRALYQRHVKDYAAAEASATRATQLQGGAEAWMLLGLIQQDAGRTDDAERSFATAHELDQTAQKPALADAEEPESN